MEQLTSMVVFAHVVEAETLSGAAARLGITKSTVSKHITALESRLRARLLNRTTRRLSPTEVGRVFYQRCRRVVDEVQRAERDVSDLRATPQGTVKVNAPMSFGHLHIVPALPDFLARYPETRVDLHLDDRALDVVGRGFDVSIRVARLADSQLLVRKLAPNRVVVCAAPAYLERHGTPERPADLRRHNCLCYTYLSTHDQWHFGGPNGRESVRVSGNLRANSGDGLREAAVSGVGVIQAPTFIVWRELRSGALRPVLTEYAQQGLWIHALFPQARSREIPLKARVLVDFLATRFGRRPYWDNDE